MNGQELRYQTINSQFYENLPHYKLIDSRDYFSLSEKYNHKPVLKREDILAEKYYLLKKYKVDF